MDCIQFQWFQDWNEVPPEAPFYRSVVPPAVVLRNVVKLAPECWSQVKRAGCVTRRNFDILRPVLEPSN